MKKTHRALIKLIFSRPGKILGLWRIRTGIQKNIRKYYLRNDNYSGFPYMLAMRVTYRCNLRCIHCNLWGDEGVYTKKTEDISKKELTTSQWKKCISEVSRFRPLIYFTGGEPLVRQDIFELIRYADDKGLLTRMASNCTLLESRALDLVDSGLTVLFASLDGLGEVNDKIRVGSNTFEKTLAGLRALKEAKRKRRSRFPLIKIHSVITKENHEQLLKLARFVDEEIEADMWGLSPSMFTTESSCGKSQKIISKFCTSELTYAKGFTRNISGINAELINQQLEVIRKSKWNFALQLPDILRKPFDFDTYFNKPETFMGDVFCAFPFTIAHIVPGGGVTPCCVIQEYHMGNIRDESFLTIWNNEKYREFRKTIKQGLFPLCARCVSLYDLLSKFKKDKSKYVLKQPVLDEQI